MSLINQLIIKLTRVQVTGLGLSVFRIFFSLILIVEVLKLFYFRHLYFDPVPYLIESELSFSLIFLGWLGILIFGLLIGFQTRIVAIINYLLVLIFFSGLTTLKYHFDSALVGLSFLFLFLPINKSLSIDSYFLKKINVKDKNLKVSLIYYYLPCILILGLQYFDSFFHKAASEVWMKGLGVWLPASLPNQVYNNFSWVLNQKFLITSVGYLVLIFEVSFLALIFVKKIRLILIVLGVSFHLFIALIFPIPTFGITYAGIYLLLLPINFWARAEKIKNLYLERIKNGLFSSNNKSKHKLNSWVNLSTIYSIIYNNQNQKISYLHQAILICFFVYYTVFGQFIKILNSPVIINISDRWSLAGMGNYSAYLLYPMGVINNKILGITENIIYTGFREGTYEVIGVEYVPEKGDKIWLAINELNGMANPASFGRLAAISDFNKQPETLTKLKKITAFWANKNQISLQEANFNIFKKPITIKLSWERDYLNKQLKRPWKPVGQLTWKNNEAFFYY